MGRFKLDLKIPTDQLKTLLDCRAEVASPSDAIRVAHEAHLVRQIGWHACIRQPEDVDDRVKEMEGLTEM